MDLKTIKFTDGDFSMEINVDENNKVWMSKKEMSIFYNKNLSIISRNLATLFSKNPNEFDSMLCKNATHRSNGKSYPKIIYRYEIIEEIGRKIRSRKYEKLQSFLDNYFDSNLIEISNDIIIYNNGDVSIDVRISP